MEFNFSAATTTLQSMATRFSERLPYLLIALAIFIFFYWLSKRLRSITTSLFLRRSQNSQNVAILLGRTISGGVVAAGTFIALAFAIPDFTPSNLVSIFGFVSVALGIAFRDVLSNLLAGIFILYTEPFRIGDSISSSGFEGIVEQIETRATFLKTPEGKRVVIPNSLLYTSPVIVISAFEQRRVEFEIRVALQNDAAIVKREITSAIKNIEGVLETPTPEILLIDLSVDTATFSLRFWIDTSNNFEIQSAKSAALTQIKTAFERAAIVFAAPKP